MIGWGGFVTGPHGGLPSPVTAEFVSQSRLTFAFPQLLDGVWWQESRPAEGGRTAIVRATASGLTEPLDSRWDARTRVHEYGGRSYLALPGGGVVVVHVSDQRLYRVGADAPAPVPLTPEPRPGTMARYADFVRSPRGTEIWCVREEEQTDGSIARVVVSVPLSGVAARDPGAIRVLASGAGFYAFPAPSPNGRWLAVIVWDHPRMPWDGTELRIVPVEDDPRRPAGEGRVLLGGHEESVLAPLWKDDGRLYAISDRSGWWNLYEVPVDGSAPRPLCPLDEEFAQPLWDVGGRPYGILGDGRLAVLHGRADQRLGVLDPGRGTLRDLELPFATWAPALAVSGSVVAGVAAACDRPWSVVGVDVTTGEHEVLATPFAELPDPAFLPRPREIRARTPSGRSVPAFVYPPSGPLAAACEGPAPYVLNVHGGPTGHSGTELDLSKAFFTSRGIGVADVNYAGSSGYGRRHRELLRGQWGVADVEDVVAVAGELIRSGLADPAKLAIRGGSAGGWTVLAAVTSSRIFSAATSYYGLSTVEGFGEETHDFESHYVNQLIGAADPRTREPLARADRTGCPVLLLQGLEDPVVLPNQSARFAEALKRNGIPHAFLTFPGESHGFRKKETVVRCLNAELSFYGQCLGFTPPGVPVLELS